MKKIKFTEKDSNLQKTPQEFYISVFKENLKNLRDEAELTQHEVALKLQVPVSTYANWEQGRRTPSVPDIFALLRVFETQANDLFFIDTRQQ